MNSETMGEHTILKMSLLGWATGAIVLILAWLVFGEGLAGMVKQWEQEEYSHGYLIPLISMFLIWQQKDKLERISFRGSWTGFVLVLLGLALYLTGSLSAVDDIIQYGFVVLIIGFFLAFMGFEAFKLIAVPLALLLFMIPLPGFLYSALSANLQLISSEIGVALIRLFGISVHLEGNVIDLGVYKLQVVEACSGLRYLFPLTTLGFLAAYFFKVELWKRILVFLSTIPITILMNSIRIGVIGITVEYWGVEMAEGVLHDFEGWAVFMGCIAVLIVQMMILTKIGKDKRPLVQVFGLEFPEPTPTDKPTKTRPVQIPYVAAIVILGLTTLAVNALPDRVDVIPDRKSFSDFPGKLGDWAGKVSGMAQIYIDKLKFDDYLMADYTLAGRGESVNLYIGYYAIQRADKVPHSPRACLPGGGWGITSLSEEEITGLSIAGIPLQVNRVVIEKGEYKQLVYYWFQQRGRVVTNEWGTKFYLLADSISESRTDGALVRLTTLIIPGEALSEGDKRLESFASYLAPVLPEYVPN